MFQSLLFWFSYRLSVEGDDAEPEEAATAEVVPVLAIVKAVGVLLLVGVVVRVVVDVVAAAFVRSKS